MLTTLFKRDSKGKIRVWDFEIENSTGRYRTIAGLQDGNKVVSEWTTPTAKNIGKANELTAVQQGFVEVTAMHAKKIKEGYFTDIDAIDTSTLIKPMLAEGFKENFKGEFPVYAQPKLDGFRCLLTKDGAFTRKGERFRCIPHIEAALAPYFETCPDAILDGELYNHDLKEDFQKIQRLLSVNKTLTEADLVETEKLVQFHIYDMIFGVKVHFGMRSVFVDGLFVREFAELPDVLKYCKLVETTLVSSQEELDTHYAKVLEQGYEGQMVRTNSLYQHKRTNDLLKRKEFQDAEFPIESIDEGLGNRSGMAGRVTCRLPNGDTFGAGIKGGVSVNKELWAKREQLKGKPATIRFFRYTNTGIPLLPVFHTVRED